MMNVGKKAFTLVEMLGAIAILAVISLIVFVSVDKSLVDTKDTMYTASISNIKAAAEMWMGNNVSSIPENGFAEITLYYLIDEGYIDEVINPITEEPFQNMNIRVYLDHVIVFDNDSVITYVDSVDITDTDFTLGVGENKRLVTTVTPSNATDSNLLYTSSNESVATVDASGLVTAKSIGSATIKAFSLDSGKFDSVDVTVIIPPPVCTLIARNPKDAAYKVLFQNGTGTPEYWTGDKYSCDVDGNSATASLNFYVLSAETVGDDYKVSLLAEQNISGTSTMDWATATSYLETNNYSNQIQSNAIWNRVDSVILPTAQQIAVAGKVYDLANWNIGSSYSNYGASSSKDDTSNISKYAWLYDYTNSCKTYNYGCNYETTSGAYGYWTATEKTGESNPAAWNSYYNGRLGWGWPSLTDYNGVRPVIILGASKLSQ